MEDSFEKKLKKKSILISGGTGSFGTTVISRLLKYNPKKIIIFSRDEKKQFDLRNKYNNSKLKFIIGDVRDKESVEKAVLGVDYIFHAAALKQVPTGEFFPLEVVKTNILGASNVIEAAIRNNVSKVVILSTDKAVYPINAMGMSKALMEKVMIAASKNNEWQTTILSGVRYGNVLYSRGSVLPHFVNLIKQGKKLSITNPGMTRFLLPLQDAVNLVLFALSDGENGTMYIRKSPACTIETLAKAVCELFEYKQGYEVVGVRAGEKMHETLISKEELVRAEELEDFYKIPPESQGLDYNQYLVKGEKVPIESIKPYTSENTKRLDDEETKKILLKLPEIQDEIRKHKQHTDVVEETVYTVLD